MGQQREGYTYKFLRLGDRASAEKNAKEVRNLAAKQKAVLDELERVLNESR
jgi:hypothetical protein